MTLPTDVAVAADGRGAMARRPFPAAVSFPSLLAALAALAFTAPAMAQDEPSASAGRVLEEIIVTAEKRSENLQEVPQAVTAQAPEQLDVRHIVSFVDLSATVPGVTVAKNEGFKTVIAIRGIGNEANQNAIANPSVSYHQDGIYVASPFALRADFLDVERIEVLRGPQGTLFGQNSTGGALNVVTTAPDPDSRHGKADIAVGNYNLLRVRGAVNVPLGEDLAMRLAVSSHQHDGFSRNIVLDQELDEADSLGARARLRWTPGDGRARFDLAMQHYADNTNGAAQKGILDPTPGARRLAQDSRGLYDLESRLYSLVAEWDFAAATLKSLTSYQDDDIAIIRDNDRNDLASLPPFALVPAVFDPETNRQRTMTQEFNIISAAPMGGRLDWVLGLFYLDTAVDVSIREYLDFGFDGTFDPITPELVRSYAPGDYGFISDSKPERESFSAYGQGTYGLADRTRLVAGLRYTNDKVRSAVTNFFGRAGTALLATDSKALTGRIALEVDLHDDAMAYGSYTRGFKLGGSNLTYGREDVIAPIVVLPVYEDETIDAWEVGVKTDFAAGAARMNAAAFYYDYRNLQYQATDPEVFEGGVGNVPRSESYGAELELLAFLGSRFTLEARLGWLNTEITASHLALDNVASDDATNALLAQGANLFGPAIQQARAAAIRDVRGNQLAKTPKFTADVMLAYAGRLGRWGDLDASAQVTRRGRFFHRLFNNPRTDVAPAYSVVNFTLRIQPDTQPWWATLLVTNAADKAGINARFTDVFGVGATGDELIAPRQIMLRLGVDF